MKHAIIIGATSGIGKAQAEYWLNKGWKVGLTGRRTSILKEISDRYPGQVVVQSMDVMEVKSAQESLKEVFRALGRVDIIMINAGVGNHNAEYSWEGEYRTLQTNVMGAVALMNTSWHLFEEKGGGHIVVVSSIAGHFSYWRTAAYNSSKAFLSHYAKGIRYRAIKKKVPIYFTDIQPGFVETPMIEWNPNTFWVISAERFAILVDKAILKKKKKVLLPWRWNIVALFMKVLPEFVWERLP